MFSFCTRFSLGVILFLTAYSGSAAEPAWFTDLAQAQTQAKAEKKLVMLFFHGSDWCPACGEMQHQVFDSPEFIAFAQQSLVLVDVDFPESATQSAELKRANQALKAKFNVGDGFPCIVLLNPSGETVYQEAGYFGGGPLELLPSFTRHAKPVLNTDTSLKFKNLTVEEFAKMAANKGNVILDVRTSKEYQAGHLVGAMNLDVNAPDFEQKVNALDKTKTYLVHCAAGVRSAKACEKLGQLDFPKLYNLPGGYKAWVNAGEPVEK